MTFISIRGDRKMSDVEVISPLAFLFLPPSVSFISARNEGVRWCCRLLSLSGFLLSRKTSLPSWNVYRSVPFPHEGSGRELTRIRRRRGRGNPMPIMISIKSERKQAQAWLPAALMCRKMSPRRRPRRPFDGFPHGPLHLLHHSRPHLRR